MADVDPGLLAVLVVGAVFIAWFTVGSAWNRRLARRLANEWKEALLTLGGSSRIQRFGTSAFRMITEGADPPFQDMSVVVTLRPREMPINWAVGLAAGRRDMAIFEASFRRRPRLDFELVDPESRIGRRRIKDPSAWSTCDLAGRSFHLASRDEPAAKRLLEDLDLSVLTSLRALRVSGGGEARMVASVVLVPGTIGRGLAALRDLAARATA